MKKSLLFLLVAMILIASCSLIDTETDVLGTYLYTGMFFSQKLFIDSTNTSAGDTTITVGAIMLTWTTIENITGDYIKIEKSLGNNTNYELTDSVPVSQNGTYTDSILSANDYYYRLTLIDGGDEALMTEYKIVISPLTISSPAITDLDIPTTGFTIQFDDVNPGNDYAVKIKDMDNNEIWSETVQTNEVTYDGSDLDAGVYSIEVTTVIQDLTEGGSVVTTTGLSQFIIQ